MKKRQIKTLQRVSPGPRERVTRKPTFVQQLRLQHIPGVSLKKQGEEKRAARIVTETENFKSQPRYTVNLFTQIFIKIIIIINFLG